MNPRRNWLSHLQSRKLHPCIAVVYEPPAVFCCCCLLSTSKLHIILNQESSKQSISETPTGGLALAPPIARSSAEPLANLQPYRSYVDAETQNATTRPPPITSNFPSGSSTAIAGGYIEKQMLAHHFSHFRSRRCLSDEWCQNRCHHQ